MRCQVSVLYFARSAELAGLRSETLSVPREITALQLWEEIVKACCHPGSGSFCCSAGVRASWRSAPGPAAWRRGCHHPTN
ncbi:molybdopterin synthase sulfur carrier subunit-like isoform X2 [Neopsephotus bourkii]|uniref:molybdopterin synthase sulfur carrier subunit-like isoform X2 n=1 Tax=Neopsephotus bourkii TaxID=309878 RepID=UPI002AA53E7E|nr:molybdopterin synthase sulfur carrier subunit-like isoform X2 [Neopsephotus bourkii]